MKVKAACYVEKEEQENAAQTTLHTHSNANNAKTSTLEKQAETHTQEGKNMKHRWIGKIKTL